MTCASLPWRSAKPAILGTVTGVLLAGAIGTVACGIACDEGTTAKEVSTYSAIGFGVLLVGAVTYIVVSCFTGNRGCAD